ncbi:MAG: Cytochrome c oxidase subunit [Pseudomonadota bacterium]|jgi:cytochrome c oxidase cbb3-type subunit 3
MRILGWLLVVAIIPLAKAQEAAPLDPFMTAPTFPAQQRAIADAKIVERGATLFAIQCKGCHGADLRGGDMGGPNLLRSQLVMGDKAGEAIVPVIQNGRSGTTGSGVMPALPLSDVDAHAVAEYIHSVAATRQRQGGTPPVKVELNLLVGDAKRGAGHFNRWCAECHSPTGDLASVATRYGNNAETLQNAWVAGRKPGVPEPGVENPRRQVQATIHFENGSEIRGVLRRMDDFTISLLTDGGQYRSFVRRSARPAITSVDIEDPLARHRSLWSEVSDAAMHDVTAYLATLK